MTGRLLAAPSRGGLARRILEVVDPSRPLAFSGMTRERHQQHRQRDRLPHPFTLPTSNPCR